MSHHRNPRVMSAAWSCSRSSGHTAPGRFARSVQERHFSGGAVICTARCAPVGALHDLPPLASRMAAAGGTTSTTSAPMQPAISGEA